jgi:hypothetical protein
MQARKLVTFGFYLSFGTSGLFNVYGSMLVTDNPVGWVVASLWSAFTFVAVEIMVRVKFPSPTPAQR